MQDGSKNGFLYLTTLLDHIMSLRKHLWMYIYYLFAVTKNKNYVVTNTNIKFN